MAEIKIKNLRPAGSEFFVNNESYMSELIEDELRIWGGDCLPENPVIPPLPILTILGTSIVIFCDRK